MAGGGGGGRIAFYYLNGTIENLYFSAIGGFGGMNNSENGTIYIDQTESFSSTFDDICTVVPSITTGTTGTTGASNTAATSTSTPYL